MATTHNQITPIRNALAVEPSVATDLNPGAGWKPPKQLGMCGFYREDQFPNGLYSVSENLMRGMAALHGSSQNSCPFELTVFHSPHGLRWTDPQLTYCEVPKRWGGRFTAETKVGFSDSAGLDAVLFPSSFTPPIVRARRAVTIIHDLQYIHFPEHWPLPRRLWMRASHEVSLRKCDAVVSISQAVKDDILKHYGDRWQSRVHSIWNPIAIERFDRSAEQNFTNGRPFILTAAVDRPVKNLATLIRAFGLLRKRFPDHCLVLAGQLRSKDRGWRRRSDKLEAEMPSAVELINDLGLANHVVVTDYIPDEQLGALYREATAFVLPSLFEGFGMPAVEAMALGAPTLVTDLPVLREVTFGAAQYIQNPLKEQEMAAQIADLLNAGDAARPSLDQRREFRQRFAPKTIAQQYLNLLVGA
jgi:glycosyltransferase involved in cell wall biosynthesis